MIADLKTDYDLTVEGDVSAFLGVQLTTTATGQILLTQTGLIDDILASTTMTNCKPDSTPAAPNPLGPCLDEEPMTESWHYLSVVGKLLYLAANSHPDISFAVHQVARFSASPRKSHALAIKCICRYLQGTKDKGLLLSPSGEMIVDAYADADFAGLWHSVDPGNPDSVRSCTGYVVTLANCPLLWVSCLQTEIALSTMEAEYIALSQCMRDLIPMRRLVSEVALHLGYNQSVPCRSYSKIFEDNSSALTLANSP